MKIIEILPELDIGGVERHVIDLSNELASRGHEVIVVSAGGQMQSQLSKNVAHITLPVHKKNPFTGYICARKIAALVKKEKIDIVHAHSRVPAWIARIVSRMTAVPYIVTAHVIFGNKSKWIYSPYRDAQRVICVSEAVREGMKDCFYDNTQVILNGLNEPDVRWNEENTQNTVKFLFVGRLSPVKGLQDALNALPEAGNWSLDIVGDGPMRDELEKIVNELGIAKKVTFHGYSDKVDEYMVSSSCLLFPSHIEGWGLTLARAAQIGLPAIASDIPPVAEMAGSSEFLIEPGNVALWREAITKFIETKKSELKIPLSSIPTIATMVDSVEKIYREVSDAPLAE